jgi:hypothetical protein
MDKMWRGKKEEGFWDKDLREEKQDKEWGGNQRC